MKKTTIIFLTLFVVGAGSSLLFMNCEKKEPDQISVRLKWKHQTQFAGIYIAAKEGFYKDENLSVKIDPIDLNKQVTFEYVLEGINDFAIGAADEIIKARSEGKLVKALAVIYKLNPMCYMSKAELGIKSPNDLIGKTVALSPGQGILLYETMMARMGIDRTKIKEVKQTAWDTFELLESGADVTSVYVINNCAEARLAGIEVNTILPFEYGVAFYADVLLTTDTLIT